MSSPTEQPVVDLFDVHGESPPPEPPPSQQKQLQTATEQSSLNGNDIVKSSDTSEPISSAIEDESKTSNSISSSSTPTSLLPFKATALIRSLSDKIPHQINTIQSLALSNKSNTNIIPNKMKPHMLIESPVSSNASSPQPPYANNKNLNMTLDKFSKEDLFKLFGKARKENRVVKQENISLKAKNKDIYKALNASNEQNEVLQITNQHLRDEYNSLKQKSSNINHDSLDKYEKLQEELKCMQRGHEEKISLIKTQSASYMNEINRLNEQIDQLKKDNDTLEYENKSVQSKIGEQYTEFTVQINALKQTTNTLEQDLMENNKQKDTCEQELENIKHEIGAYKEIARKAETNIDRIESLEEELRDKIRENHQLQIKTRSLNTNMKKLTEKLEAQNNKIHTLQQQQINKLAECEKLNTDNKSYREHNKLLNEKLNILLKENAENTFKSEKQIGHIENYHLSKYKTLLHSFQMMKKRIEANNKLNENNISHMNHRYNNIGYSNEGWKKYHEDITSLNSSKSTGNIKYNHNKKHMTYSIDLDLDENEFNDNINDLNHNINELSSSHSYDFDSGSGHGHGDANNMIRKYQSQFKEYRRVIHSLQGQLKQSSVMIENEREITKKYQTQNKRLNKPKHINIDYLRNVLVKFLILSEYLTDEQIVLVPVFGSILSLSKAEKDMIDNSYNQNVYFMGANTLFPENANAKYSPQRKKKRKKRKERDKRKDNVSNVSNTNNTSKQ